MTATARRERFNTRTIRLVGDVQRQTALSLLQSVPLDAVKPLELVIREEPKVRGLDANARMWVGPLADIAEQGYVNGRTYSPEVWHEHFKELYLPPDFDAELTKEGYRKYDYTPSGSRVLVGSTTELTVRGFALYLQQIEAFGASLGVMFTASPREQGR